MPPAAPLPTTMTSQRSLPGLIESASRFDSSSARVRLTSRVGSSCIVALLELQIADRRSQIHLRISAQSPINLPSAICHLRLKSVLTHVFARSEDSPYRPRSDTRRTRGG